VLWTVQQQQQNHHYHHHQLQSYFTKAQQILTITENCVLHIVTTSSCSGHVDELVTEPFLLLHREHGTGYRRSWNCCDQRTRFIVIRKHFCFILFTGTGIQSDSVMHPWSSSRGRNTSASVTVTELNSNACSTAQITAHLSDNCNCYGCVDKLTNSST